MKGDIKTIQQFHPFNLYGYDEADPYANMSPEDKQKLKDIIEAVIPKFKPEFVGHITIFGTGGDFENTENLKELFYASENQVGWSGDRPEHVGYWMPEYPVQKG